MPTVSPDMVDTVQNFDIEDLLDTSSGGAGGNNTIRINGTAEIVSRRELVHVDMADTYEIPVTDGYIRYGHYEGTGPAYTTQEIQRVTQDPIDSNTSIIKRSTIKQPYNTSVDPTTGKLTVSGQPKSGMLSANAAYFINAVNAAQFCTSVGVALGKGFDQYLYDSNPDYWDSIGLSTLNPETWGSITAGNDSLGARVFNSIFGIDSDTGKAQMYIDSDAFAYVAQCMKNAGIFDTSEYQATDVNYSSQSHTGYYYSYWQQPIKAVKDIIDITNIHYTSSSGRKYTYTSSGNGYFIPYVVESRIRPTGTANNIAIAYVTSSPNDVITRLIETYDLATGAITNVSTSTYTVELYTYITSGTPEYYLIKGTWDPPSSGAYEYVVTDLFNVATDTIDNSSKAANDFWRFLNVGTVTGGASVPGVTDQPNATHPTTANWTDQQSTDSALRQQYPDLYSNAIKYDVPDAQGNLIEKTYVPVAWPTTTANPWTDVQPTTDTAVQNQTQTMVDLLQGVQAQVGTLTKTLADTLTRTVTQPVNTTPTGTVPPAENPTNTGSGASPVPVTPTGNASALWSVYHPTQAQIDAFGAWLWGSVFTTDIRKLFEDPIQSVISLHKIYASPIDSGTGTIVAGTLDSGVSSATVFQQYVTVSCGSVSIQEDFGNVFDYQPHTSVSLYLPFIGIVPLDVNDVMRSTITVTYGVDVFTGACLAMVDVSRDGGTVNMYQYAGVCSVQYPLSNVQQSQMVTGLLSIAAGIGAAVATGGVSIPASVGIAGGAAAAAKTSVGRSGGFSGNAGAMGIKKPYVIITRPQTKIAGYFPSLDGYPTNISGILSEFSGQVVVSSVHVEGINATDTELAMIENALHSGVLI